MTRIAVLCDIHGNLPALEAVVPELEVDLVVLGGDVASGPFPAETLELLRSLPVPLRFVRGNADRVLDLEGIPEPVKETHGRVAETVVLKFASTLFLILCHLLSSCKPA